MRRSIRTLTALSAVLSLATPAYAGGAETPVSLWGSTGLIMTPTAHVLGFEEMQLSGGYVSGANQGFGAFHMGLFQGLEAGVNYNLPGGQGAVAGDFKFRLLKQNGAVPFSLAVGGIQLGGTSTGPLSLNNQLYMVLGHDLQWTFEHKPVTLARLSLGFGGNLGGAQPMANLQVPVLGYGAVEAEFVGQRGSNDALLNVGLTATPLPWLGLRVATLGSLTQDITSRSWLAGVNLTWMTPRSGSVLDVFNPGTPAPTPPKASVPTPPVVSPPAVVAQASPTPAASPVPGKPNPAPSPVPGKPNPAPSATPVPEGVVQGKVTSAGKGVDKIPLQLVGTITRKTWSGPDGTYKFPPAPLGAYKLKVQREGWKAYEQDVTVGTAPTEVNIALTALPATLKGQVTNGIKGVGGITVAIESLGVVTLTKEDGTYILNDIPAGSYTITYMKQKKQLDKVTLTLGQGETVQRNLTLSATDAPPTAKALVKGTITDAKNTNLPGARIMLEGKDLTVMTISGPDGAFILRELPAGTYKLTVSKQNFVSRLFTLTLKPGQEAKHTIALNPTPKP